MTRSSTGDRTQLSQTATTGGEVEAFVRRARAMAPVAAAGHAGLMFALDATMSRQPTWDRACALQADMFAEAARSGGLKVKLVYYRGFAECRASRWVDSADALGGLMGKIACQGGHTQIVRVLRHAAETAAAGEMRALVFVGDAFEEDIDDTCAAAGGLALRGVPAFMFQEGNDPAATRAFAEVARLTRGAHCRFGSSAGNELAALLRGVAAYAAGGVAGLERLASRDAAARPLLAQMR